MASRELVDRTAFLQQRALGGAVNLIVVLFETRSLRIIRTRCLREGFNAHKEKRAKEKQFTTRSARGSSYKEEIKGEN